MNLEERLQAKVKELDALKARLAELDDLRTKTFQHALEVQGATKMLMELVNIQKAEAKKSPVMPPLAPAAAPTISKKKKEPVAT